MSRTAYLVGFIDIHQNPPKFIGCGLFSEPTPTISGYAFTIIEERGETFQKACEKIEEYQNMQCYKWTRVKIGR